MFLEQLNQDEQAAQSAAEDVDDPREEEVVAEDPINRSQKVRVKRSTEERVITDEITFRDLAPQQVVGVGVEAQEVPMI